MSEPIITEDINFVRLDKDTTPVNYQPGSYFDLLNMRIISDDNSQSTALTNFKGNSYITSIPDTPQVAKISLILTSLPDQFPCIPEDIDITIGGITNTLSFNGINILTLKQYYQYIVDFINNSIYPAVQLAYLQNDNNAIMIQFRLFAAMTVIVTFTGLTTTAFTVSNNYVPQLTNLKIIGWVNLRETIYLITTNGVTVNPGGVDPDLTADPITYGQIWRLTYDKITKVVNPLELLYNNVLNLTIQHAIANPGGIEARYENELIQKIYWTDNFNTLRSFNTADPNGFALLPTSLNIATTIQHTIPVLERVFQAGGSLITGIHQIAYRLKNTSGGESTFSEPSNLIHITAKSELLPYGGENYTESLYEGSNNGAVSSKCLRFRISDLDTIYDRIEIISLVRENIDQSPIIDIIADLPLPKTGTMLFIYTGNEPKIPITLNEFNGLRINFQTVKSITQKNNKLFPGNIKLKQFDIDWDSRTYRFKGTAANTIDTLAYVRDSAGNITTVDSANWTLASNHDAIQDYNSQSPDTWVNNLYQATAVTPTIGGEGPNIKYSFTVCDDTNDDYMIMDLNTQYQTGAPGARAPYRVGGNWNHDFTLDNQTSQVFHLDNNYRDNHSPYISGLFKGYQRDEMYRFGIVFYDVLGNPGFVNWIADIRMPSIFMPDITNAVSSTRTLQFSPTFVDGNNELHGYNIGIVFDINFQNLSQEDKNKIRGFSIVRVKREDSDKHILGQGSFHPVVWDTGGTNTNYLIDSTSAVEATDYTPNAVTFDCPEFYFNGEPQYATGDTIDIIGILEQEWENGIIAYDGTYRSYWHVVKNYEYLPTPPLSISDLGVTNNPYPITGTIVVKSWADDSATHSAPISGIYSNVSRTALSTELMMGNKTLLLEHTNGYINFPITPAGDGYMVNDGVTGTFREYMANYKRVVVKQYGGDSFSERSTNEYILCSDYFPIPLTYDTLNLAIPNYNCTVYGGDTFLSIYDHLKKLPNKGIAYDSANCVGKFFPVESSVNIELRQADKLTDFDINTTAPATKYKYVFNKTIFPNLECTGVSANEEWTYNPVYSSENDVKIFFPKPDPYIANSEFDVRIYNSEEKNNGELADSWGIYKEGNFINVDGVLGPINNLITLNNSLLYFQDKGVGKVSVEEKAAVATSTGDLTIGTSGILSRYDYITRASGSKHQFGFTQNDETVWYFDIIQKTLFELTPQGNVPVSDIKGLHSHFQQNLVGDIITTDNPYIGLGITATYDFIHKEAVFTFLDTDNKFTVSYVTNKLPNGDITRNFIGFYSYTPKFYINDKYNIITTNVTNNVGSDLWMHDVNDTHAIFYGIQYPCKLTVISNKYPKNTKILTNLQYLSESIGYNNPPFPYTNEICDILNDTWDLIRIRNSKQNTDFQAVQQLAKRKQRDWNIKVPKDRVQNQLTNTSIYGADLSSNRIPFGKKMRDKYFYIDFQYNNNSNIPNNKFIMHYLTNLLRVSPA